ncbi:MAG: RluA family pseudouridine synthase [Nitrospirae bacterium]|nr:RluA family pseudouridine synthase [Nitrospirota bacterium]
MKRLQRIAGEADAAARPTAFMAARLDVFLAAQMDGVSKTLAGRLIDLGAAYVNGKRVRIASRRIKNGDEVVVHIAEPPLPPIFALTEDRVLFRDAYLLAIDKPAGFQSQPTLNQYKGCVYEAVERYLARSIKPGDITIGMPQRLDRDVSGVMLFSIASAAHKPLTDMFRDGIIRKTYLALCETGDRHSQGAEGVIDAPIRHVSGENRYETGDDGVNAVTGYRILEAAGGFALVEFRPVTGRTHQIRVHAAHAGMPIIGDRVYGIPYESARVMLHAAELAFTHPVDGREMAITSPLPRDFDGMLKYCLKR